MSETPELDWTDWDVDPNENKQLWDEIEEQIVKDEKDEERQRKEKEEKDKKEEERQRKEKEEKERKKLEDDYKNGRIRKEIRNGKIGYTTKKSVPSNKVRRQPIQLGDLNTQENRDKQKQSPEQKQSPVLGGKVNHNRVAQIAYQNERARISFEIKELEERNIQIVKYNPTTYVGGTFYNKDIEKKYWEGCHRKFHMRHQYNNNLKLIHEKKLYLLLCRYMNKDIIQVIFFYLTS
jgi:hypothetical protein